MPSLGLSYHGGDEDFHEEGEIIMATFPTLPMLAWIFPQGIHFKPPEGLSTRFKG